MATFQTDSGREEGQSSVQGILAEQKEQKKWLQKFIKNARQASNVDIKSKTAAIVGQTAGPLFTLEIRWQNKRPHKTVQKKGGQLREEEREMTSTSSVYKYVMEDVIKNIKHEFLSEGIPESVLAELQQVRCRAAANFYLL